MKLKLLLIFIFIISILNIFSGAIYYDNPVIFNIKTADLWLSVSSDNGNGTISYIVDTSYVTNPYYKYTGVNGEYYFLDEYVRVKKFSIDSIILSQMISIFGGAKYYYRITNITRNKIYYDSITSACTDSIIKVIGLDSLDLQVGDTLAIFLKIKTFATSDSIHMGIYDLILYGGY